MLNRRLGEILINKPKKYKQNYTDRIIQTGLRAYEDVQKADSIYLSKYSYEQDFFKRRDHLQEARGAVQSVASECGLFLDLVRHHDYAAQGGAADDGRNYAKLYDQALEIGGMCEKCYELISGVLKADNELYKKAIRGREAPTA